MRDQKDVGSKGTFEHDGHVGGVEQLDGVRTSLSSHLGRLDGDFNSESLEVNDHGKDGNSRKEIHDVGESLPVESLLESSSLVVPSEEEVEEGNDGTLKLGSSTGIDGVGGEGLPDDVFANVGSDEQGDTRSKTVALGEQLIEEDDNERGRDQLENEQQADTGAEGRGGAVETGKDVDGGLAKGNNEGEDWTSAMGRYPQHGKGSRF